MFLLSCCHSVSVRISTVAFKNMGRRALNSTLIFLAFPYAVLSYVPPKAYALLATSAPPRDSLARGRHQAAEVAQGQESAAPASSSGHSAGSSASGFGVGSSRASGSGFLNAQLARAGEAARAGLPSGSRESMRSDAKSLVDGTMKHMKALNEVHARIFFKEREVGGGVGVLPGGAALTTTKKGDCKMRMSCHPCLTPQVNKRRMQEKTSESEVVIAAAGAGALAGALLPAAPA